MTNRTPYAAERSWVQDKAANKIWIVVVKATYTLPVHGQPQLAEQQVPVMRLAEHAGEPGKSSLKYEADLFGVKTCTDVLVRGSAWPGGRRRTVDVRLSVASVRKHLRVFGDRVWSRGIVGVGASEPELFETIPLDYERAYGGWDRRTTDPAHHRMEPRNPIGTGFAVREENCVGLRLPNVEYPEQLIRSWKDRPRPAGLNAVDCSWSPRRELAGTYDERWLEHRHPLWAEDFDPRYNNCAPQDQQVDGYLRGGEAVELINLSAEGRLAFNLPRAYPFFQTVFGRERVEHRAQLCTVIIEPDARRLMLVWQTSLVCNHRADELDMTIVIEKRAI